MKYFVFFILINAITLQLFSQIVFNSSDMPNPNDTFLVSVSTSISGFDPVPTGENYFWDCSSFNPLRQEVDTYFQVTATPLVYNVVFNNFLDQVHKATVATRDYNEINPVPTISISEIYNFYKESSSEFRLVGFGAKINNVQTPVKYDVPALIFTFPLTMNHVDSSTSFYELNIPNIGYFGRTLWRKNTVDGWGTIVTPLDTFDVVRVNSEVKTSDSIFYQQYGIGVRLPTRTEYEYKWMADNSGIPVMQVNKNGMALTARYKDIVHNPNSVKNNCSKSIHVFPNPTTGIIEFSSISEVNDVIVFDLYGNKLFQYKNIYSLNISFLPKGIYILKMVYNQTDVKTERIVKL